MNFGLSVDQREIQNTARALLEARFSSQRVRELIESTDYDHAVWQEVVELGWPGIAASSELGGAGLGMVELVVLQEELGRSLAPLPFLSVAAAALLIEAAGSRTQQERWLPPLLAGEARGAVGIAHAGVAPLVMDAVGASFVILVEGTGAHIYDTESLLVTPRPTIDLTRRFARVDVRGAGEPLDGDVAAALDRVLVAVAADSVGCAQRALEMSVTYAGERRQFGQPIGAFQAVAHRCAQMLLETESARSATYHAAWAADHDPPALSLAAPRAKAYSSDAGWRVPASSVQVHGGIGFTWEHDAHLVLKRGKLDAELFGSARSHRERIGLALAHELVTTSPNTSTDREG